MLRLDADGIHLGQTDLKPDIVREHIGPTKTIGLSIESMQELHIANQLDCINYVAASSVFVTNTKSDIKTIWEVAGLKQFCKLSKYPVIAIGRINLTTINLIKHLDISMVAIISAIHNAHDPREYIKQLLEVNND